jgi:4-hydroxy-3-methylbut-2-en-1-yl diphosphate reductase
MTVICVPMRVEQFALRGASARVIRTGMGPARSRPLEGVLVAGVGGGLAAHVRAGDVVVATEVRGPDGLSAPCASADQLASDLRELGLTVHLGPIASATKVVSGAARATLAATGASAVDTESIWLAPAPPAPYAVVRVITDTAEQPLLGWGILARGTTALRTLRRTRPALDAWVTSENLHLTLPKEVS